MTAGKLACTVDPVRLQSGQSSQQKTIDQAIPTLSMAPVASVWVSGVRHKLHIYMNGETSRILNLSWMVVLTERNGGVNV